MPRNHDEYDPWNEDDVDVFSAIDRAELLEALLDEPDLNMETTDDDL